jgi:TonB-linked SusC/RagA family outer membrane protein
MKKLLLASLCFLMFCVTEVIAQNRTVTGTVTAKDDGLPLPGVTVQVKGARVGTQTDANGKFSLSAPPQSTLQFSFIGYASIEVSSGNGNVNVSLNSSAKNLGEVIVTGTLGRKFEDKSRGYAATHLTASQANLSSPVNFLTGLTGKVAGLQITQTGTGVNAGIKVQLRGSRSINGNNQALIVVDGVPLPNGDISSIDPNSIESYDVLNGGSAGVLYGSEASNGVVVITTKKGAAGNKPVITYSNSFQTSTAAYYPKIQKQFGQNGGENIAQGGVDPWSGAFLIVGYENELYGPAYDGSTYQLGAPAGSPTGPKNFQTYDYKGDPVKDFYNVGIIEQNMLGVSSGNADDYINILVKHSLNKGITPTEKNQQYFATLKGGKRYGIFKAEYNVSYTNSLIHQVGADYNAQNVNYAIQQWPTDLRIKDFSDPTSTFANPSDFYNGYATNPYWAIYNAASNTTINTLVGNINLTLNPTKYLDLNYKLTNNFLLSENRQTQAEVDFTPYSVSDPQSAGNIPNSFAAAGGVSAGQVSDNYNTNGRLQSDFLINFHPSIFKDFKTNLLLGNTFYNIHTKTQTTGSNTLLINGLYNIGYIAGTPNASESETTQNQIAFYGDLSIGYKGWAFLDGSLRNEQDSRLNAQSRSYWYPGITGSLVFTDAIPALKNNKVLSFGKLRAAYSITAQIGVGAYQINNTFSVTAGGFPFGSVGGLSQSATNFLPIVPERVTEIEFGTELGFFDNLVHGSFTWYKQNNKNQTLGLGVSNTTGYSTILQNVGELQSSGFEVALTVSPLTKAKNKVNLDLGMNLADQESKVISLLDNVPQFGIANGQFAVVGQPYPYIEGNDFNRDPDGRVIVSATTGLPTRTSSSTILLGRSSPEWIMGLNAAVGYKFIQFSTVAEFRTGFVSNYSSEANSYLFTGSSAYTTQNGRQPFIYPNSVINTGTTAAPVYVANTTIATADGNDKYWVGSVIRPANGATQANFVTSGAFWKIREANLSFDLTKFVKNMRTIKALKFSLTGRNLFIWTPKTNFWGDPETSAPAGSGTQPSNSGQVPSISSIPGQRIFGARLDVTF